MKSRIDPVTGEIHELQDVNGWEIPDPNPMALPVGFKRPETLAEQVARLVRSERWKHDMEKAGLETFEESEDFDVGEDFDPSTPYETFFDPTLGKDITPQEFSIHEATYKKRYLAAQRAYYDQVDAEGILAENLVRARARAAANDKLGGEGGNPPSQGEAASSKATPKPPKSSS
ncbi:MAG: hypothetical protein [Microvirus sp.]|nr:MAG: hypothetical protein [Microvirus sp.]